MSVVQQQQPIVEVMHNHHHQQEEGLPESAVTEGQPSKPAPTALQEFSVPPTSNSTQSMPETRDTPQNDNQKNVEKDSDAPPLPQEATTTTGDEVASASSTTASASSAASSSSTCPSESTNRRNGLSRQWSSCSLCSIDSHRTNDGSGDDHPLPIPGRESHTANLDVFYWHLHTLAALPRPTPPNLLVWTFFRNVLAGAVHGIGYTDGAFPNQAVPKGPRDNQAFLEKLRSTHVLNPIHPKVVAAKVGVPVQTVLTELLYATKTGFVTMRWIPFCEICQGKKHKRKKKVVTTTTTTTVQKKKKNKNNTETTVQSRSPSPAPNNNNKTTTTTTTTSAVTSSHKCEYRNAIDCLEKIRVVFSFHVEVFHTLAEGFILPAIDKAVRQDELFCVVPATFTGSGFRYSLGCGGDKMFRPALKAGKYRMHCPVALTENYLVVERDATEQDEPVVLPVHVSDLVYHEGARHKTLRVPHGKVHLDIFTDTQSFFVCWIQKKNKTRRKGTTITTTTTTTATEEKEDTTIDTTNATSTMEKKNKKDENDKGDGSSSSNSSSNNNTNGGNDQDNEDAQEGSESIARWWTSAEETMNNPTYMELFEGTEEEEHLYGNAVKRMVLVA